MREEALLIEDNVISLRTAFVLDDGDLVDFRIMPAWLDSSVPRKTRGAPKDYEWALQDSAWLYRHLRSEPDERALMRTFPTCLQQDIRPMAFKERPEFRLIWTDSGNGALLYLDGQPWAFTCEETHLGYSKGILKAGNSRPWDQNLFEKIFVEGGYVHPGTYVPQSPDEHD